MSVTKEDIKKISRLARIKVEEQNIEPLAEKINGIISWAEVLNEVNTDNVEILTSVHNQTLALYADEVLDGNIAEDILKNSKDAKYGYFAVPKVLES